MTMSGGGVGDDRSRLRRRCRSEGLDASPFVALRQARLISGDTLANRGWNYPLGNPERYPIERPLLERFPLKSPLDRSPGRSPLERSPGRSPLERSPGRSTLERSPGRSPLERSPGRSPLDRSPLTNSPPSRLSPERHRGAFNITTFPQLNGAESPILARKEHTSPNRNSYRSSPTRLLLKNHKELTHKDSPIRNGYISPYRQTIQEDRLPKVEELFEKLDYPVNLMDYSEHKQPLKSILNNPRKSPPLGILKKKKGQEKAEAKRRPRAASESESFVNHEDPSVSEGHPQNSSSHLKRMKDNSGAAYAGSTPTTPTWDYFNRKSAANAVSPPTKDKINGDSKIQEANLLRTTAIRRENSISPVPSPEPEPSAPPHSNTWLRKRASKCRTPNNSHTLVQRGNGLMPVHVMETEYTAKSSGGDANAFCKLAEKLNNGAVLSNGVVLSNTGEEPTFPTMDIPHELSHCMRPSLFPRVPPYYKFINHDQTPPLKPPLSIAKHLKWKLTSITPIVVKKTLLNSGFKLVRSDCETSECPQEETVEWVGIWGKHMKSLMFRSLKDGQKMNHFPGTFQIGRKDRLWRNLQKLVAKHGMKEFGIMPKTYVLPYDLKLLKRDWDKYYARNEKWIIKPPASARGTGIAVVSRWSEIPKKRPVVVQRYVSRPYLINGSKFDLRLYVLVTSVHPIKIYLFSDGLARFASVKYTDDQATLHDRYMHLTNYSINRMSKNYTSNEDAGACQGHKWTLQTLLQYLKRERGVDTEELWERLKELVIKTILSAESTIRSLTEANITSRYNCYELFGIDVLLDEDLKPWLLEVNISPSLHSSSPLDLYVKAPLVTAVLNIAQFHLPRPTSDSATNARNAAKYAHVIYDPRLYTVYLSKEERDKHIVYSKMEDRSEYLSDILSTLTPDDVRHLVQAEDELAAGGVRLSSPASATTMPPHMERIFPTAHTHQYLHYLPTPKYYNRLLDAWENKYRNDRTAGINLLRSFCEMGYHLEVPPVPIKRELAARVSDTCRVRPRLVCRWRRSRRPRAPAPLPLPTCAARRPATAPASHFRSRCPASPRPRDAL